jgi:hypothetical protein
MCERSDTVATSAFTDKSKKPTEADLSRVLGRSKKLWDELRSCATGQETSVSEEWKCHGEKYGWSLVLRGKKRNLLYMSPREKHFMASCALGEKAVAAAESAGLPPQVLEAIRTAPRYPEGRPARIEVRTAKDLEVVKQLLALKMSC